MEINHKFYSEYKETNDFTFGPYNKLVDVTQYEEHIIPNLEYITAILNKDPNTRQAVIIVSEGINTKTNMNSCLLSLQFQLAKEQNNDGLTLFVTANYRSLCEKYGQPNDMIMLNYVATLIKNQLHYNIADVAITVNVGNYHKREEEF
jgi:hypothetical protein